MKKYYLNKMNSLKKDAPLHQNNFDLLRLIFASMVVFFHIAILSQVPGFAWMTQHISSLFAVQAFFIVSGYLVTMSYEKSRSLGDYWKKRMLRIAPAYVFVVVGAAVLLSLLSTLPFAEYFSSKDFWRYIAFNLALANFNAPSLPGVFLGQYESAVNVSLWTIKIEVLFYACVPVIVWAVRKWGYNKILGLVFFLSLAWKVGFFVQGTATGTEFYFKMAKQLPGQLCFFAGGAWCFYKTREGFRPPAWMAVAGILLYYIPDGWLFEMLSPIAVTMLVSWAAISMPRLGNVGKHGDFSFGIYLFHAPIAQVFISLGLFSVYPVRAMIAAILCIVLLALFSWNYIEQPFLRHRKQIPKPALA
ncbi:acyltransferase family protein [Janthinobacterium sp. GB1R12]|uniref:acyltransferase family protein n=1 Tax=Janthinobacterium sp. GB1R12 TaxID=3424190 RepID=UPI003F268DFD